MPKAVVQSTSSGSECQGHSVTHGDDGEGAMEILGFSHISKTNSKVPQILRTLVRGRSSLGSFQMDEKIVLWEVATGVQGSLEPLLGSQLAE